MTEPSGQVETAKDIGERPEDVARRWLREIDLASQHESKWRKRARKVVDRYRDEDRKEDSDTSSRFNILYANTEVLKGVMYQRTPVPDVRRRFLDRDPVGRQAAQILQRGLSYAVDAYDFDDVMMSVVEDVLLPGRGVACVKYVPTMAKSEVTDPASGQKVMEDRVAYQEVRCEYVEWEFLRISPAKRWRKVRWIAIGDLYTRDDLVRAFGEKGRVCTLNWAPKDKEHENDDLFKRALVWAVWDKTTKKVVFVSQGHEAGPLAEVADPLGLQEFFPIPKPIYSVSTTDSLTPVPEFLQYQDQAIELDNISARIDALVGELRVRGIADMSLPELQQLAKAGDGEFVPIESAERVASLAEKGGLEKAILFWPIEKIAGVLANLYEQREQIKAVIYEITGIADIVRGSTKATETLGAQELKARYANVRVGPRQKAIANLARDLFRMKAEIIAEKFTPEMLKLMTGPDVWTVEVEVQDPMTGQMKREKRDATTEIMELLRNEKLRGFRVDIETDSTIQPDATEEQRNRIEFLGAVTSFVNGVAPAVQSGAMPMYVAKEFLAFGARAFKASPQLEDAIERIGSGQQEQKPDPEAERLKGEIELKRERNGAEMELQRAKLNGELELQREKLAKEHEFKLQAHQAETRFKRGDQIISAADKHPAVRRVLEDLDPEMKAANAEKDAMEIEALRQLQQQNEMILKGLQQNAMTMGELLRYVSAPRRLVRDQSGRAQAAVVDVQQAVNG